VTQDEPSWVRKANEKNARNGNNYGGGCGGKLRGTFSAKILGSSIQGESSCKSRFALQASKPNVSLTHVAILDGRER
jgi:hypothetical protein